MKVWIVTHDMYLGQRIVGVAEKSISHAAVQVFYGMYAFRLLVSYGKMPNLIITTGICREDHDGRLSYFATKYDCLNELSVFGRNHKIPIMRVPSVLGFTILWLLRLKLWWWKIRCYMNTSKMRKKAFR